MQLHIHTANLIEKDWHYKTQGVWSSPVLNKGVGDCEFERDLCAYLGAYKCPGLNEWIMAIQEYDWTRVKGKLVASVPGRHRQEALEKWGHVRLRTLLQQHYHPSDKESHQVVVQVHGI
jgi:tyrosyl-DNA phosphodiesterase-1